MTGLIDLLIPVVRGLLAASLVLLIGLSPAARLIRVHGPPPGTVQRDAIEGWFARLPGLLAWFFLTCSLLRGALQVLTFVEPGEAVTADLLHAVLLEGSWGTAWIAQSTAAFLLLAISWLWRGRARVLAGSSALLVLVLITAQTYLGHATEELWRGALGHVVHGLHLLGSGVWLGTLAILMLTTLPMLRDAAWLPTLTALTRGYSMAARVGVLLVVGSGAVALWTYSDGQLLALIDSTWGQLLLLKLLAVAGALLIGWWNWRVGTPALAAGRADAAARMRRAIGMELLLGVVILGLTAWLIGAPLPSHGG